MTSRRHALLCTAPTRLHFLYRLSRNSASHVHYCIQKIRNTSAPPLTPSIASYCAVLYTAGSSNPLAKQTYLNPDTLLHSFVHQPRVHPIIPVRDSTSKPLRIFVEVGTFCQLCQERLRLERDKGTRGGGVQSRFAMPSSLGDTCTTVFAHKKTAGRAFAFGYKLNVCAVVY